MKVVGIGHYWARKLMPLIGMVDIGVAIAAVSLPSTELSAWATVWAFATALMRPLSGEVRYTTTSPRISKPRRLYSHPRHSHLTLSANALLLSLSPLCLQNILQFVERAGNWTVPLALLHIQTHAQSSPPAWAATLARIPLVPGWALATSWSAHLTAMVLVFEAGILGALLLRITGIFNSNKPHTS